MADLTRRAAASGLEARTAWEFECLVLEPGSGTPTAAMADNRCWSALTMACEEELLAGLVDTLTAGGVPVDHLCAELGPGCLEIATAPEDTLRSADSALLAKLYTKAHFSREGRQATFMAQLGPQFPGLGGHPSLSLHSTVDGTPVLCEEPGVLSKVGASAVAGVIALLPELLALAAPVPQLLSALRPRQLGPGHGNVGPGQLQLRAACRGRRPGVGAASSCGSPART